MCCRSEHYKMQCMEIVWILIWKNKCKNTFVKKLEILDSGFLMKLRDYSKYLCRLMVLCSLKESLLLEILTNKRNNMMSEIWLKII